MHKQPLTAARLSCEQMQQVHQALLRTAARAPHTVVTSASLTLSICLCIPCIPHMLMHAGPMSVQQPPPLRAGRITAELFVSEVPKTAENFRCLCTGEKGLGKSSKKPLHLKVSSHAWVIIDGSPAFSGSKQPAESTSDVRPTGRQLLHWPRGWL